MMMPPMRTLRYAPSSRSATSPPPIVAAQMLPVYVPSHDPRRHDEHLAETELRGRPGRVMTLHSELVHAVEDEGGVLVRGQDARRDVLVIDAHGAREVVLGVGLGSVAVEDIDVRLTEPPLHLVHGEASERIRLGDLLLAGSMGLRSHDTAEGRGEA